MRERKARASATPWVVFIGGTAFALLAAFALAALPVRQAPPLLLSYALTPIYAPNLPPLPLPRAPEPWSS